MGKWFRWSWEHKRFLWWFLIVPYKIIEDWAIEKIRPRLNRELWVDVLSWLPWMTWAVLGVLIVRTLLAARRSSRGVTRGRLTVTRAGESDVPSGRAAKAVDIPFTRDLDGVPTEADEIEYLRKLVDRLLNLLGDNQQGRTAEQLSAQLGETPERIKEAAVSLSAQGKLEARGEVIQKVSPASIPSAEAVGVPTIIQGPRPGWRATCDVVGSWATYGRGVILAVESDGEEVSDTRCRVTNEHGTWDSIVAIFEKAGQEKPGEEKHFPGDFTPKPPSPLPVGEYRAEWLGDVGDVTETHEVFLAGTTFNINEKGQFYCSAQSLVGQSIGSEVGS
jgi:hypothetical protein